jgi:hypothetical protein
MLGVFWAGCAQPGVHLAELGEVDLLVRIDREHQDGTVELLHGRRSCPRLARIGGSFDQRDLEVVRYGGPRPSGACDVPKLWFSFQADPYVPGPELSELVIEDGVGGRIEASWPLVYPIRHTELVSGIAAAGGEVELGSDIAGDRWLPEPVWVGLSWDEQGQQAPEGPKLRDPSYQEVLAEAIDAETLAVVLPDELEAAMALTVQPESHSLLNEVDRCSGARTCLLAHSATPLDLTTVP